MYTRPAHEPGGPSARPDRYLTFILAGQEYGVNILRVQEIKGWSGVTEIPGTPDYVRGVVNLRGSIVPIVDLRRCFGIQSIEYDQTTVVIMLKVTGEREEQTMGFVVDAVSDVYDVGPDQRRPAPDFGDTAQAGFVTALATIADKMVILIDIDRLVATRMASGTETEPPQATRGPGSEAPMGPGKDRDSAGESS
jgi:purine-binding chemotaxis protein CheW